MTRALLAAVLLAALGWGASGTRWEATAFGSTGPAASGAPPAAASAPQATPGPCEVVPSSGSTKIEFPSGGIERNAILHIPSHPTQRPLPLLIALHGWGGTGARFEQDTGFSTLADRDRFAVLYPSAHGTEWVINGSDRDVTFISELLERVKARACIDPRRIYATGVSNGARMAARLGCVLSDQLAAIAPIAGGYSNFPACDPERPVSVLEIHGTEDTTVPYEGKGPSHEGAALAYVFAWAARDGCGTTPSKRRVALHTVRYTWSDCRGGSSVEHLRIYGGRHGMPDSVGAEISSGGPYTISGADQVWRFLAPLVQAPPNEPAGDEDASG